MSGLRFSGITVRAWLIQKNHAAGWQCCLGFLLTISQMQSGRRGPRGEVVEENWTKHFASRLLKKYGTLA